MIQIALRAQPGARVEAVSLGPDGVLDVKVRAPALDGRANEAVVRALAAALHLRPRQIRLVRGARSRDKLVEIDLADRAELARRLTPAVRR